MLSRLAVSCLVFILVGCATTKLPGNLSTAILDSEDIETVKDGLPSYLLMVDALTLTYPKSDALQLTAASLNGAYSGVFIPDSQQERKKRMANKALNHALNAFCLYDRKACNIRSLEPTALEERLQSWGSEKDLPYLYALGTTWASQIQANSDDWLAVAELGKAELVLKQLVTIDPEYQLGTALLYLGVMNSILPPSLGGKPDVAKEYYESALNAGQGKNLIIYVYYASNFARLIFDQELHDTLLNTALNLDPHVPGYTLQNTFAQQMAKDLLASSNDYF